MSRNNTEGRRQKTPEQKNKTPETGVKIKIEKISDTEADKLLEKVVMPGSADPFQGEMLSLDIFKKNGIKPQYKIEADGTTIWLSSNPYNLGQERIAATGFIEHDGNLVARSFWRSNSQGLWRLMSAYEPSGKINKETGEESLALPIAMQKALSEISMHDNQIQNIPDHQFVFYGTATSVSGPYDRSKNRSFHQDVKSSPVKLAGKTFNPKHNGTKTPPYEIGFENKENEPDFSNMTDTWLGNSQTYGGQITFECFPSKNNQLTYIFCRDKKDRVWIGGIEVNNAPITAHGVKESWVYAPDLTTPAYEYPEQADTFGNDQDKHGEYIDTHEKYLSQIPMIAEYKRSSTARKKTKEAGIPKEANKKEPTADETKKDFHEQGVEREKILKAVDRAVGILKKNTEQLNKKDSDYIRLRWVIRAVEDARKQDLDENGTFEVCEDKGSKNCQREGIPVDDLLEELQQVRANILKELDSKNTNMKALTGDAAKNTEELIDEEKSQRTKEIDEIIALIDSSATEPTDDWQEWRKRREAHLFHKDDYRKTGDATQDWLTAESALKKRRELRLPKETKTQSLDNLDLGGDELDKWGKDEQDNISTFEHPLEAENDDNIDASEPTPKKPESSPRLPDKEPTRPGNKAYLVDISKIVERLAWSQAEEKTNAYIRALDPNNAQPEQPKQATQPEPKRGIFERFTQGVKDVASYAYDKVKTVGRHIRASMFVRPSESFYLEKFYRESLREIQSNKNLLTEIEARLVRGSAGKAITAEKEIRHYSALNNIIETFSEEVAEDNEKGELFTDPEINTELAELFFQHATGTLADRKQFDEAVEERILPIIKKKGYKFTNANDEEAKGLLFAHNFFELAKSYKDYIDTETKRLEQKYGPENAEIIKGHLKGIMGLEIQLGLKERDIRETKPKSVRTWVDKLIDKAQNTRILGHTLASPLVMAGASAMAVGTFVTKGAASMSFRALAAAPIVSGVMGGVLSAARRGRDLQYDRGAEARRAALGQDAGGRQAEKMREFTYDKMHTEDVVVSLENISNKPTDQITDSDRQEVANILAALGVENTQKVDMFAATQEEGRDLNTRIHSINQIKILLKRINEQHELSAKTLRSEIQTATDGFRSQLEATDSRFKNWRHTEQAKAAAIGAIGGFMFGAAAECVYTTYNSHFGDSWIGKMSEYIQTKGKGYEHDFTTSLLDKQTELALGGGLKATMQPDHTVTLFDKDGNTVLNHIKIDSKGGFDQESIDTLRSQGYKIMDNHHIHSAVVKGMDVAGNLPTPDTMRASGFENNFSLPAGWKVSPNPEKAMEMFIFDKNNTVVGLFEMDNQTGAMDPASLKFLEQAGWNIEHSSHLVTTHGHDAIAQEFQKMGGSTSDIQDRVWHNNMDPYLRQVTSHDNPVIEHSRINGTHQYKIEVKTPAQAKALLDTIKESMARGDLNTHPTIGTPMDQVTVDLHDGGRTVFTVPTGKGEYVAEQLRAASQLHQVEPAFHGLKDLHTEVTHLSGTAVSNTIHDGKELRAMLEDRANAWAFSFKHGIEDMVKGGKINWDHSVDYQYGAMASAVKSGDLSQFNLRFYLSPEDFKAGHAISVPLDASGEMIVPKGSNIENLLMDAKGNSRLTWEVAFNGPDGKAHILSTVVSKGGELPDIQTVVADYTLQPSSESADQITIDTPDVNPYFIPLTPNPRKPLESGVYSPRNKGDDSNNQPKPPRPDSSPTSTDKNPQTKDKENKKQNLPEKLSPTAGGANSAESDTAPVSAGASAESAPTTTEKNSDIKPLTEKDLRPLMTQVVDKLTPPLDNTKKEALLKELTDHVSARISAENLDAPFTNNFIGNLLKVMAGEKELPSTLSAQRVLTIKALTEMLPNSNKGELAKLASEKTSLVHSTFNILHNAIKPKATEPDKKSAKKTTTKTKKKQKEGQKNDDNEPKEEEEEKTIEDDDDYEDNENI